MEFQRTKAESVKNIKCGMLNQAGQRTFTTTGNTLAAFI